MPGPQSLAHGSWLIPWGVPRVPRWLQRKGQHYEWAPDGLPREPERSGGRVLPRTPASKGKPPPSSASLTATHSGLCHSWRSWKTPVSLGLVRRALAPSRSQVTGSPGAPILKHAHTCGCQAILSAVLGCYTNAGGWATSHTQLFTGEKQAEKWAVGKEILQGPALEVAENINQCWSLH